MKLTSVVSPLREETGYVEIDVNREAVGETSIQGTTQNMVVVRIELRLIDMRLFVSLLL